MSARNNNEPRVDILLLTIREAAKALGLSRATLYLLIKKNIIPTIRIGRAVRISSQALQKLVEELEAGRLVISSLREARPKGEGRIEPTC